MSDIIRTACEASIIGSRENLNYIVEVSKAISHWIKSENFQVSHYVHFVRVNNGRKLAMDIYQLKTAIINHSISVYFENVYHLSGM